MLIFIYYKIIFLNLMYYLNHERILLKNNIHLILEIFKISIINYDYKQHLILIIVNNKH